MGYNLKYKGAKIDELLDKAATALQEHQDISGKQDVITDLATIRSNAAKGATALQSVPSEYITETELTDKGYATISAMNTELGKKQDTITDLATIRSGAAKGATALQSHQDISHLATKTEVNAKVDKVTGKQLSTEDFTTALKNKLNGLNNYDDTAVNNAINGLQTQINTLVSGDANTAIESFNEIIAFLDGVTDTQTLEGIIAGIEQQIAKKQDTITDLATIRSGAAKGATALQSHQDISGKLDKTEAASTYLSKTDAASTYLGKTSKAADATKADSATKATQDASGNVITTTYATKTELNNGLAGKVSTVSGKGLSTNDYTTTEKNKLAGIAAGAEVNVQSDWTETYTSSDAYIKNKPNLAAVATSGSYNDLSNKPTIPSAVTESTVSGWGFTKNTGTYSKPSTGIPKSDLASAVQTSLGKADSALQSYTETDPVFKASAAAGITSSDISNWNSKTSNTGTITGIKMNGASKGTSGVVDLGTVITSHQDISGKQDTLVSGTNIKTINGESVLGSGDIKIEGSQGSGGMVNITYSELVGLRNNSQLVAGQLYRMIDYETIVSSIGIEKEVNSAGNPFDLILIALNENTLNERCCAIQSARDTNGYFSDSNLSAWDIKYCIDNDTERFDWCVSTSKGVIYHLTDEYNNEAGYDFKNILYKDGSNWYYTFTETASMRDASLSGMVVNNTIKQHLILPEIFFKLQDGCYVKNSTFSCVCSTIEGTIESCNFSGSDINIKSPKGISNSSIGRGTTGVTISCYLLQKVENLQIGCWCSNINLTEAIIDNLKIEDFVCDVNCISNTLSHVVIESGTKGVYATYDTIEYVKISGIDVDYNDELYPSFNSGYYDVYCMATFTVDSNGNEVAFRKGDLAHLLEY